MSLNAAFGSVVRSASPDDEALRLEIVRHAVRFGAGTNRYGGRFSWTLDTRRLLLRASVLDQFGERLWTRLRDYQPDGVVGVGLSGSLLVAAVMHRAWLADGVDLAGCVIRSDAKTYGLIYEFEGDPVAGRRVVFVDDILHSARTLERAVDTINQNQGHVVGCEVVIRFANAKQQLRRLEGLSTHALFRTADLGLATPHRAHVPHVESFLRSMPREPISAHARPREPTAPTGSLDVRRAGGSATLRYQSEGRDKGSWSRTFDHHGAPLLARLWPDTRNAVWTQDTVAYCASSRDGRPKWNVDLERTITDVAAVGPHLILIDRSGVLTCLDEHGRVQWTTRVEPAHSHILVANDRLLMVSWARRTVVFSTDGRLQSIVGVGTVRRRRLVPTFASDMWIAGDRSPNRLDYINATAGQVLASTLWDSEILSIERRIDGVTILLRDGRATTILADPGDAR